MNPRQQEGDSEMSPVTLILRIIGTAIVVFVAVTVIFGCYYTIDETQRGVLLRNGAFVSVVQPGWHMKTPWIDSVTKIDMQTHTKTYGWDKGAGKSNMEAYSADTQPAHLRVSVTLHVSPDKVQDMYARFGGDYDAALARIIEPHVHERIKVVFGQYTAARAIANRGQLNADAASSLVQAISYDPVFSIESVQIEDISFSGEYIKSIEARMRAEVEVQQFRQQLEREKVQAEIKITQANGEAGRIRAEAEANADAIKLRGLAEAETISARAAALAQNQNLVSLIQAEKWNGVLPTTMLPGGAVPMLSLPRAQ